MHPCLYFYLYRLPPVVVMVASVLLALLVWVVLPDLLLLALVASVLAELVLQYPTVDDPDTATLGALWIHTSDMCYLSSDNPS